MSLPFSLCICFASIVTSNFGPSNSTWALLGLQCKAANFTGLNVKHLIEVVDLVQKLDFLLILFHLSVAWPDFSFILAKVPVFCSEPILHLGSQKRMLTTQRLARLESQQNPKQQKSPVKR